MLETKTIKKIEGFVHQKPRSIQEIALHLNKNWRTADRYVQEIEKNFGTISTRIFREGTRGALKIVFWKSFEKASSSIFQEQLETEIMKGKTKYDFSGFDIFQYVQDKSKYAWIKQGEDEIKTGRLKEFKDLLLQAEKQVLFFSGNLSFINFEDEKINIFKILDKLVKKDVNIKVISRVDLPGLENIKKLLSLNFKYGKELIEIHHREQPLRITIIDNKLCDIKEVKESTGREKELNKKTFIFYTIRDKDWIEWLSKIFWNMFSSSINVNKRLEEMKKIKTI
ncbi:hypothetical protein HYT56_00305 [Candidatus Woesearchaeota archaeon]|nr:hypothetical protein [Candidatus Woesearchaeota archaeon]